MHEHDAYEGPLDMATFGRPPVDTRRISDDQRWLVKPLNGSMSSAHLPSGVILTPLYFFINLARSPQPHLGVAQAFQHPRGPSK